MSTRDPRPVMVLGEGKSKLIHKAKCNECDCLQEPLPESMRVLLCLIEGAERRGSLMMRWSGRSGPARRRHGAGHKRSPGLGDQGLPTQKLNSAGSAA
jgi:hypothetical protein